MASYKVGISYERYGYLGVDNVDNEEEVAEKAREWLENASVADMDQITSYLEDSEEVDTDAILPVKMV